MSLTAAKPPRRSFFGAGATCECMARRGAAADARGAARVYGAYAGGRCGPKFANLAADNQPGQQISASKRHIKTDPGGGTGVAGCKLRPQRNGEVAGCRKTRTGTSGCRFHGRARPARIPRGTPRRAMQSFEYRSVPYWSKEINGTLTGGQKKLFF